MILSPLSAGCGDPAGRARGSDIEHVELQRVDESNLFDSERVLQQFRRGVEEANRFLPCVNFVDLESDFIPENAPGSAKVGAGGVRKKCHALVNEGEVRRIKKKKQVVIRDDDDVELSEMFDRFFIREEDEQKQPPIRRGHEAGYDDDTTVLKPWEKC